MCKLTSPDVISKQGSLDATLSKPVVLSKEAIVMHYITYGSDFYGKEVITKPSNFTCNEVRVSAIFGTFTLLLFRGSNDVTSNESQTDGRT